MQFGKKRVTDEPTQVRSAFGVFLHCVTDQPTDGSTHRMTYRIACTQLTTKTDVYQNKAVYTTAPVAYGWAGTVTQVKSPYGVFLHSVTERPTDQQ